MLHQIFAFLKGSEVENVSGFGGSSRVRRSIAGINRAGDGHSEAKRAGTRGDDAHEPGKERRAKAGDGEEGTGGAGLDWMAEEQGEGRGEDGGECEAEEDARDRQAGRCVRGGEGRDEQQTERQAEALPRCAPGSGAAGLTRGRGRP